MILSPLVVNGHKAPPYSNATSLLLLDHCLDLDLHFSPIVLDHAATPLVLFDLPFPIHVQLLACLLGSSISPPLESNTEKKNIKCTRASPTYHDP